MDFADYRALLALADTLSITKAAERLHIAQPPLSRRLAAMEAALGVQLFRRERPLVMTEAGRFLAEQARQLLARAEEVEAATRRIGGGRRRYFGIGFVGSTLYGILPRTIRALRLAHPDVEVGLLELTTAEQRGALEDRRIDVGFGRVDLGDTPGITRIVISDDPLMLAVAADHRWAAKACTSLAEIAREPFIPYPSRPRPSFADHVIALFRAAGHDLRVAIEANDLQTALGLVAADTGVTLVPASVAASGRIDLRFLSVVEPHARSPVILSHRTNDSAPLLRRFLALVETALADPAPDLPAN